MQRPSVRRLAPAVARVAAEVDRRLRAAGHQAWIVGGAVRDLALGRAVADLDWATDAEPDELERLFDKTHAVGRAFGTIIVVIDGLAMEVTTFRSESGYSDGRRPDRVEFGHSAEEDAKRRDFTVNALYLDVRDRVLDPTGGLADLEQRRLRAVGDPRARFGEDGLRIVRLARFAATLGFAIEDATQRAATAELASLRGVSTERVLHEWERGFGHGVGPKLVGTLFELGALSTCVPGLAAVEDGPAALDRRVRTLAAIDGDVPFDLGLAVLLDPRGESPATDERAAARAAVLGLRPPRELARAVEGLWVLFARVAAESEADERPRSSVVRLAREPRIDDALRAESARRREFGRADDGVRRLAGEIAALDRRAIDEAPWITARDLTAAGLAPGPLFGTLLQDAETAQLDRALADRDAALAWVRRRARQLGGNH